MSDAHLRVLEAEAIHILREARFLFARPVLLYSIGKDSSVLHHLTKRAFHPAPSPFPLLHVDTTYKFQEMIQFRDALARRDRVRLIVKTNHVALAMGLNPFDTDAATYTSAMKTSPLREALDEGGFDVAIGGARRDEERSRAKEHVFSLRGPGHTWEPRDQRAEFFRLYNTALPSGSTMRSFPLSDWTELDVWRYIRSEALDVVPLYFARPRPVVVRQGQLIVVDDDRMRLFPGEQAHMRTVRFRTLGCWPLTAAVESDAVTVDEIIQELGRSRVSERAGRLIDHDGSGMEEKKREGYF